MPELEDFLNEYHNVVDKMLKTGLFYPARDKIIKDRYIKLLPNMRTKAIIEQLAVEYKLSESTIKDIIYRK